MAAPLELLQIAGSPNSVKVRVALGYKELPYTKWDLPMQGPFPFDRAELVRISTQPRTPVIRHGSVVLFGSDAILRYLDANFPDTRRLFSEDFDTFAAIERWELFGRSQLGEPVGMVFGQALSGKPDPAVCARARALFHERTVCIEDQLGSTPFLVGDALSAADVTCAPAFGLTLLGDGQPLSPIARVFREHFQLDPSRERSRDWAQRVLAYDRG